MLGEPTSFVILWCQKASHAYLWHIMLGLWSCMHARRQVGSACVSHPHLHGNTICPNREGDTGCRVSLHKIEELRLRKVHNGRNWPTNSGNYPNEAHWHGACLAPENDSPAAKLGHQHGLTKGQIHVSGGHSLTSSKHTCLPEPCLKWRFQSHVGGEHLQRPPEGTQKAEALPTLSVVIKRG